MQSFLLSFTIPESEVGFFKRKFAGVLETGMPVLSVAVCGGVLIDGSRECIFSI